jgi:hypothetical protein
MLCDDDVLVPSALKILFEISKELPHVQVFKWQSAFAEDVTSVRVHQSELILYDSVLLRQGMFESGSGKFGVKSMLPIFPLIAVRRELIDAVRMRTGGEFFYPLCPMTSGALGILAVSELVAVLDLPLTVVQHTHDSVSNIANNPQLWLKMQQGTRILHSPLISINTLPSGSLEALLRAAEALGLEMGVNDVNIARFFLVCNYSLTTNQKKGANLSVEWGLFDDALDSQPVLVRSKYYIYIFLFCISITSLRRVVGKIFGFLRFPNGEFSFDMNRKSEAGIKEKFESCVIDAAKLLDDVVISAKPLSCCRIPARVVRPEELRRLRYKWFFRYPSDFCLRLW